MKKINGLRHMRLQPKLFLFSMTIAVITVFFLAFFWLNYQTRTVLEQIHEVNDRATEQLSERLSLELKNILSMGNILSRDAHINNTFTQYNSSSTKEEKEKLADTFSLHFLSWTSIHPEVILVALDGTVLGDPLFKTRVSGFKLHDMPWYEELSKQPLGHIWIPGKDIDEKQQGGYKMSYIYLAKMITPPNTWTPIGVMLMAFSETELEKLYSAAAGSNQSIFILDHNNNVVSGVNNLGLDYDRLNIDPSIFVRYSATCVQDYDGYEIILSMNSLGSMQWKILSISTMDSYLSRYYDNLNSLYLVGICYVIIALFISYFFTKRFIKPIHTLTAQMSKVKSGQLDAYVSITTHDEIGELSGQFNSMLSEINTLMERIITEQEAKRSADILALQTQMNPHFLFNTLATIRSLVCANAFDKADTVLISLSMLLKDLLSSNEPFSTLNKEIQNLQEYINIQKLTFEPPLNVHIQIPPEMHNIRIMKMLLQPLVENALLHGLKPKRDNCRLNIEGYLEKEMAVISIADNGVGFNPDILEHYSHDLSADKRSIGIKNVVDRIKLHYGTQCSININSEINVGTTVIVRFPQSYTREDFKL